MEGGGWVGGSPFPVLPPLRLEEELSSQGARDLPMEDSELSWEGQRAACSGPAIPLGSKGGSEGSEILCPRGLGESGEAW